MNTHPLLQILNTQQRAAVAAPDGPSLVLAGPGSGKTRVLTHRIAWMLSEMRVPAWQVLAVTFTNKAAREMRQRLEQMLGDAARDVVMGTFHAFCARVLRREAQFAGLSQDYLIFDTDDQLSVMKQVVSDLNLDDSRYRPRSLLTAISAAKNELITPTNYPVKTYYDEIVVRAYTRYQDTLRQNNGLDFDDLLTEAARLFKSVPDVLERYQQRYTHVLVDEFQDTNMAQYVLLKLLAQEHQNLYVVADEDQMIYSWRGADYRNIQRFRGDFPTLKQFLLEENYRSTQVILDAAQAIISGNRDRTPKQLFTRYQGGALITLHEAYDEREEADYVARETLKLLRGELTPNDLAVMYRTNAQSRALEEAFVGYNISYRLIGATRFYSRMEIKDILAYLRLVQNPDDDISFVRVINTPKRGLGDRTLGAITQEAALHEVSRYQGMLRVIRDEKVSRRPLTLLRDYAALLQTWLELRDQVTVAQLLDQILRDIAYEAYLRDGSDEGEARWENVLALRAVVADAPSISLTDFLTEVALVADVDELTEGVDAVTMLTLHSAKGLEYPVVFITGLEEGMLPHSRSMETSEGVAEERRLLYVGMTRAEQQLYLSYAFRRSWGYYGNSEPSAPSRFLGDLPANLLNRSRRAKQATTARSWATGAWEKKREREAPPPPQLQYRSGQRVRHTHYGEGIVMESQLDGRSEMVTVHFEGVGVKRLLASMAPMEPVPEH
ncbi:MAG: UvrD-helicase domain-containing protein [Anaerolineae bacterium]|nr:UvrD-helicase domain-containing protein [Anaerolineae bacterium]